MKDQAQKALELVNQDKQRAIDIARGYDTPPKGLLPEAVFTAVEDRATRDGDFITLRQLAQSTRTTEATAMGQRIRALAEREPNSAVGAIQSINKAKTDAVAKRLKQPANRAVNAEVKKIKAERKPISKSEWSAFIESIRC